MRPTPSALAAALLHRQLLSNSSDCDRQAAESEPREIVTPSVRRNPDGPRLSDDTVTHPHRPRGHGA